MCLSSSFIKYQIHQGKSLIRVVEITSHLEKFRNIVQVRRGDSSPERQEHNWLLLATVDSKHTATIYMIIPDCIAHWVYSKFKCDLSRDINWRKYWLFNAVEVYPKILLSDCLFCLFFFDNNILPIYNYVPWTVGTPFQNKIWFCLYILFLPFMTWKYFNQDWFSMIKENLLTLQSWCVTSGWRRENVVFLMGITLF